MPTAPPSKLLTDNLFYQLQDAIIRGEIPQGSKISEPGLARQYQVSRGPLREALSRLEAKGLVERIPNAGARVVTLTLQEVIDIYQIRETLAGMACSLAARNMTDEEISELHNLLDEHEENIRKDGGLSYYQQEGDFDFHYRILKGSKNTKIIDVLYGGLYQVLRMYRFQCSSDSSRPLEALKEHRRIAEAISQRDSELAELLMRRHIQAARQRIEAFKQTRDSSGSK